MGRKNLNHIQKTFHIDQQYYPIILIQKGKTLSKKLNCILKQLYEEKKNNKEYNARVNQFEQFKTDFDDYKKNIKEKELIKGNSISHPERNDKCLTIIFNNNIEKHDFMKNINQKEFVKFIKYDDFIDIIKENYRI